MFGSGTRGSKNVSVSYHLQSMWNVKCQGVFTKENSHVEIHFLRSPVPPTHHTAACTPLHSTHRSCPCCSKLVCTAFHFYCPIHPYVHPHSFHENVTQSCTCAVRTVQQRNGCVLIRIAPEFLTVG